MSPTIDCWVKIAPEQFLRACITSPPPIYGDDYTKLVFLLYFISNKEVCHTKEFQLFLKEEKLRIAEVIPPLIAIKIILQFTKRRAKKVKTWNIRIET